MGKCGLLNGTWVIALWIAQIEYHLAGHNEQIIELIRYFKQLLKPEAEYAE